MTTRTNTLLVASFVASGGLFAQPEVAPIDSEAQLRQQIAELQAEAGARPASLVDPLRALAALYQEDGDDALAVAALEEARYVTRIHNGLATADEALLLRQQIRSEKALGNHERAWDLEQARQHHDDVRMVPIFRDLADDRLGVIEQFRAGKRPETVALGCYYGAPLPAYDETRGTRRPPVDANPGAPASSCSIGDRWRVIRKLHSEILMYYADAIEIIVKTGDYSSEELREFEKEALRVASKTPNPLAQPYGGSGGFARCSGGTLDDYLALEILGSCLAPVGRADRAVVANVGGRVSLIRLITYAIRSGAPVAVRANAIAELADWEFLSVPADRRRFDVPQVTFELYERAYRELQQSGDLQAATQIFAPELPVTLPTYEPNPFASAATESRYIDVSFDVTKYGTAERIEVLVASKDATRDKRRDLIRLIESTTFRPRFIDGKLADVAPAMVRYDLGP